jgi:hypothetical protein
VKAAINGYQYSFHEEEYSEYVMISILDSIGSSEKRIIKIIFQLIINQEISNELKNGIFNLSETELIQSLINSSKSFIANVLLQHPKVQKK